MALNLAFILRGQRQANVLLVDGNLRFGALDALLNLQTSRNITDLIPSLDDDDPDVLRMFTRMLLACDETLEVETASSGEQAPERMRSTPFDVVLLDIVMPDVDGWQVLELVHQDERMSGVPIFFVSAQDPADQPLRSPFLLSTIGKGLSLGKLLSCSLEMSALLLKP